MFVLSDFIYFVLLNYIVGFTRESKTWIVIKASLIVVGTQLFCFFVSLYVGGSDTIDRDQRQRQRQRQRQMFYNTVRMHL